MIGFGASVSGGLKGYQSGGATLAPLGEMIRSKGANRAARMAPFFAATDRRARANRVTAAELVRATLKYGDVGTIRRMGVLLERAGVTEALLRKLRRMLAPSSSQISWIPQSPKRGAVNQRWGVVENDLELKRA
jgi:hypothetical protein